MTNTKNLELLTAAYKTLNEDERRAADYFINYDVTDEKSCLLTNSGAYIGLLIASTKKAIYEEESKKSGGRTLLSAVKKILKEAAKSPKEILHYAYRDGEFTYICDGFRILKTPIRFESLEAPASVSGEFIDCEKFLNGKEERAEYLLTLPSLTELKAYIKTEKAAHKSEKKFKVFYDFGDGKPAVNAEYLLDMLEAIPDAKCYMGGSVSKMIYITDGNGTEGMMCPVRKESIKKTA